MLEIPKDEKLDISFRAESVDDGVLITGSISSIARGECGRCLDALTVEIDQKFQELFLYQSRTSENPDDDEELFTLDGDIADLEIPKIGRAHV